MKATRIIDKETVQLVLQRYRDEVHRINAEEAMNVLREKAMDVDTVVLTIMHEKRGYGKKRLQEFIKDWREVYDYYNNRYDDADLYVMRRDLLKLGIDVEALSRELNEQKGAEQN